MNPASSQPVAYRRLAGDGRVWSLCIVGAIGVLVPFAAGDVAVGRVSGNYTFERDFAQCESQDDNSLDIERDVIDQCVDLQAGDDGAPPEIEAHRRVNVQTTLAGSTNNIQSLTLDFDVELSSFFRASPNLFGGRQAAQVEFRAEFLATEDTPFAVEVIADLEGSPATSAVIVELTRSFQGCVKLGEGPSTNNRCNGSPQINRLGPLSGTLAGNTPLNLVLEIALETDLSLLTQDPGLQTLTNHAHVTVIFDFAVSRNIRWSNPLGGEFNDAANWTPAIVPTAASDTAIFELSGNSPVPIQASNATAGKWEIGVMTLDLNGAASILGNSPGLDDLLVNRGGGLLLDGNGGPSSLTTNTMLIDNGQVTVDASAGSAVLALADALIITGSPNNELLIAGGGEVTAGTLSVGRISGTTAGDVTVRGVSPAGVRSTLAVNGTSEPAVFGGTAPGRLNVQAGGSVALFGGLTVGLVSDGFVLVSGQDAPDGVVTELRVVGETNIGIGAASSVEIQTSGRMTTSGNVNVGVAAAESSLSIRESSFLDVDGTLTIGAGAAAELNINNAQVSCDSLAVGGGDAAPAEAGGVITLDGFTGLFQVRGNANVGVGQGSGNIILNLGLSMVVDGTMTIGGGPSGGNVLLLDAFIGGAGNILVGQNGILRGTGTVSVPKTRLAGTNAFISPGLSPGTLTIDGDYEQAEGGTLIIEVAGLKPGQFDVLRVTGNATLSGSVDLRFIDGFVPQPGDNVNFVVVDGALTGKLTGSTFIDAPGDPESGQSGAQAEVVWEVTPEGTCRLTITDVTPVDANGVPLPAGCGAGLCGAGVVPMAGLTLVALCGWRGASTRRRHRPS
ncbi:MAG: hypothetical protein JNG88_17245 [Phycisphaerales bacterium]|nr:hypothetical protein [Phycisphaerales bacterium]